MAPEVLDGAITFEKSSFVNMDMYACGLVLWELASRCEINHFNCENDVFQEGQNCLEVSIENYKLPYEDDIPNNPTIDQMKELVVNCGLRPKYKTGNRDWKIHGSKNKMIEVCKIIDYLWDGDADARTSAACLVETIHRDLLPIQTEFREDEISEALTTERTVGISEMVV